MLIKNPWHNPRNPGSKQHFEVSEPAERTESFDFHKLHSSVLVVRRDTGEAVTQCVTIDGAKRALARR